MKKLISLLYVCLFTSFIPLTASANTTSLDITVKATVIDVVVTPYANIVIDPNTGDVTIPTITITNNTPAPVIVDSSGLIPEVGNFFNLVVSSKHGDREAWGLLTKAESQDLAFTVSLGENWKTKTASSWVSGIGGTFQGTLSPTTTATVIITDLYHGNSFVQESSSSFAISWVVSLE